MNQTTTKCANGCTVEYGPVQTQSNFGMFTVIHPSSPQPRSIVVSNWELAKQIGELLIQDFGGAVKFV